MLKGEISPDDEAFVEVTLMINNKQVVEQGLIDTGFNGHISVPTPIIQKSDWPEFGFDEFEHANGELVRHKIYAGEIVFNRVRKKTLIVETGCETVIIGTKLLTDSLCQFDFGSRVVQITAGNVL